MVNQLSAQVLKIFYCYDDPDPLGISLVFAIANSEYSDEDD
jgi:hypothetical protein